MVAEIVGAFQTIQEKGHQRKDKRIIMAQLENIIIFGTVVS